MHVFTCLQVKLLLGMLVKKCGLNAVKAVMPEEHMKLLTNIRKVWTLSYLCWTTSYFC